MISQYFALWIHHKESDNCLIDAECKCKVKDEYKSDEFSNAVFIVMHLLQSLLTLYSRFKEGKYIINNPFHFIVKYNINNLFI